MTEADRFAAALVELFEELDWRLLGEHYCHDGGDEFFDEAAREALLDGALCFASDVSDALESLSRGSGGPGRSVYVGAAVSELGPILCETLVLDREVTAFSLDNAETRELNRVLRTVAGRLERELFQIDTADVSRAELELCDHVWMVSVLNDPASFPALHDELYERKGTELAVGGGDPGRERDAAHDLLDQLLAALRTPGLLTCSDEELPLVRAAAQARGLALYETLPARLSPIVWDPVRSWRVDA